MPRLVLSELLVRIRRSAASRRPSQVDERSLLAPPFHPHLDPAAPGRLIASRCSSVRRSRRPARALAGVEALRRIWPTCFASSKRQAQIGLVLPEWAECHAALVFVVDIARRRRPWLSLLLLLLSLLALSPRSSPPRPPPAPVARSSSSLLVRLELLRLLVSRILYFSTLCTSRPPSTTVQTSPARRADHALRTFRRSRSPRLRPSSRSSYRCVSSSLSHTLTRRRAGLTESTAQALPSPSAPSAASRPSSAGPCTARPTASRRASTTRAAMCASTATRRRSGASGSAP